METVKEINRYTGRNSLWCRFFKAMIIKNFYQLF
jgi:hypothetical protein